MRIPYFSDNYRAQPLKRLPALGKKIILENLQGGYDRVTLVGVGMFMPASGGYSLQVQYDGQTDPVVVSDNFFHPGRGVYKDLAPGSTARIPDLPRGEIRLASKVGGVTDTFVRSARGQKWDRYVTNSSGSRKVNEAVMTTEEVAELVNSNYVVISGQTMVGVLA